jgi:Uma2 family endonuclease
MPFLLVAVLDKRKLSMVQTPKKTLTLEEFLKLPETKPASEYIDGQVIQKPMPQGKHSTVQTEFSTTANAVLKPRQIARSFSELRCTFGGRSIVPDMCVFVWRRIPVDEQGNIANLFPICPDWTIEVLSPEQSPTKVIKNILHCLNHGCQLGWLIDPEEQSILIFSPGKQPQLIDLDSGQDILPVPSFAVDLQLTIADVFGWLKL